MKKSLFAVSAFALVLGASVSAQAIPASMANKYKSSQKSATAQHVKTSKKLPLSMQKRTTNAAAKTMIAASAASGESYDSEVGNEAADEAMNYNVNETPRSAVFEAARARKAEQQDSTDKRSTFVSAVINDGNASKTSTISNVNAKQPIKSSILN